jgi:hypothetical protein
VNSCRQKLVLWSNRIRHSVRSIKKLEGCRRAWSIMISKGKGSFIKDDMPRDDDAIGGEVKAAVSFVMVGIAKKDAQGRPGGEFVRGYGGQVGITFAAENP